MNTENIKEEIELGVEAITVEIPVRVTMTSYDNAPLEFTCSIDEMGQILLTPNSKDVEFTDANTDSTVDYEIPIMEQETITSVEGQITTTQSSILIHASMLAEETPYEISADVDQIGQAIIYPTKEKNIFISATFENSLNLITEKLDVVEYFGYKLVNSGDGWDIISPEGTTIENGVASLPEAKILVCTTEINKLKDLSEGVENADTSKEELPKEEIVNSITAEVVEESVEPTNKSSENSSNVDVVTRFLTGDVALFSDNGKPLDSYVHLSELDAKGYEYYYDPESDCVVSYPTKG